MNTPNSIHAQAGTQNSSGKDRFARDLLDWYDRHARTLPWRMPPARSKAGELPDPYHVWLSEVMLQQTQVATVREYYLKFLAEWPSVKALASADNEDVMKAWAGLGYYSRARNLKKCAETVATNLHGEFPSNIDDLKKLPGIGDYTSAAIAAIAFQKPVAVVDGNIERVITRQYEINRPVRDAKSEIKEIVTTLLAEDRPGDFAQAMMDLGATLCSPKKPACGLCPVNETCGALHSGTVESYPVKLAKTAKPIRKGAAFIIQNQDGSVYLQKRKEAGLLGGMTEVPGTHWTARIDGETGKSALPVQGEWKMAGTARHTFTHFHLELEVWYLVDKNFDQENGWWSHPTALSGEALPTVFKKAISVALPDILKDRK